MRRILIAAVIVLFATACAVPGFGSGKKSDHACADLVANAAVGKSVVGMWKCLAPSLQQTMNAMGNGGKDEVFGQPFGSSYTYMGSGEDTFAYEVRLTPEIAIRYGKEATLTVWVDSQGKVSNAGIALKAYS